MRRIILATLASGVLLGGTDLVLAECQTLAQARAANPNTYLSYRLAAGSRCWYPASSHHRDQPSVDKPRPQSSTSSNDDKPDGAGLKETPIDFRNAYELDTVAPPPDRAPYQGRIAGTFNTIGLVASVIGSADPARLDEIRAAIYGPQPAPAPGPRASLVGAAAGFLRVLAWILLTIGVGTIGVGLLNRYADHLNAPQWGQARSSHDAQGLRVRDDPNADRLTAPQWGQARSSHDAPSLHAPSLHTSRLHMPRFHTPRLHAPRLRARDYPSGRTPLVNFIAYLEPSGASGGWWRSARDHMALGRRTISSWLLRTG